MDSSLLDLRYAVRMLLKSYGFTAVSVGVLALWLAANTAMFSIVNAVILRPFPYHDAGSLVSPISVQPQTGTITTAIPYVDYQHWKQQRSIFEGVAVAQTAFADLASGNAAPERMTAASVSEDFFSVLKAVPVAGRDFTASDHLEGSERTIVISDALWHRRFAASPAVIGQKLRVRGVDRVVVGIMPKSADFPQGTELWIPAFSSAAATEPPDNFAWSAVARLAPGVSMESARSFVEAVGRQMVQQFPANRAGTQMSLVPLNESIVGTKVRRALITLLIAVGLVQLIVAANLANLMLNRASARAREFSIRSALGATPGRLVRQLLVEATMLSCLAVGLGSVLAIFLTKAVVEFGPQSIPRLREAAVDVRVLLFGVAVATATTLLFAMVPAFKTARPDLRQVLQEGSRATSSSPRARRYRDLLVIGEVGLSFVLLISAGLMAKSFLRLQHVDPGVRTDNVLTFDIALPSAVYSSPEKKAQFVTELQRSISSIPGVRAAGGIGALPIGGGGFYLGRAFVVEGQPLPPAGTEYLAMWNVITPSFLQASGLQLLSGRGFGPEDTATSAPVIILSQSMAKRMFPDKSAIGNYVRSWRDDNKARQVVGIVSDVKVQSLDEQDSAAAYVPHAQDPWGVFAFAVRTRDDPGAYVDMIRKQLSGLDPNIAIANVSTMAQIRDASLGQPRFNTLLSMLFSALALILALVGLFGVVAYSVSQRTREFGVRMALGAQPRDILQMVLKQGLLLAVSGIAFGLLLSAAAARITQSLLFQVQATDIRTYVSLCLVLTVAALLAAYVPARRATHVDPVNALHYE
jgi:putative ABC transport system permease protein